MWLNFSSNAFIVAFFLYCFAFMFFVIAIAGKNWRNRDPKEHTKRWSRIAFTTSCLALAAQLTFFITRWIGGGHYPISNMYEFMTFLGMAIMAAFTILYLIYRSPMLGVFALPLTVIIIAYASVFPQEVQPLIPALNSYWLPIHVSTASLGDAFFAVAFVTGLIYLIRTIDYKSNTKAARKERFWGEFTMYTIVVVIGFLITVFAFRSFGYQASFVQQNITIDQQANEVVKTETVDYGLPPIFKPYNSTQEKMDSFLGMQQPPFEAPSWMHGVNAGRKLNTVVWSLISGSILYGLLRLVLRKPIGAAIQPITKGIDPELMDEITYRAIAIGFPIFTLGAIIFAMIWANIAWSRFWGWDPKEVWALITWLFYSAYLHLRLSRGWQGRRSAWLAVIGFIVVMFTLIGVNLVISGLHSYSGT